MKRVIVAATGLFVLACSAFASYHDGLDAQGNKLVRDSASGEIFVQCLDGGAGDFLRIDLDYQLVVHSRQNGPTWMFSAQFRESGTASDSFGNLWNFNGHWKINETSEDPDWQNREHLTVVENLLFVSQSGAPNLKYSFTREVRWRDGEQVLHDRDFTVTCLNNSNGG